jgi:hypothetical protein
MNENGNGERRAVLKIPTPWGPMEIRGISAMLGLLLVINAVAAYAMWEHLHSTEKVAERLVKAFAQFSSEQRRMACIIAFDQGAERKEQLRDPLSLCNRMARGE